MPSLRDSDQVSHFTRHFAYGCVSGYDCSLPAALDFEMVAPPLRKAH